MSEPSLVNQVLKGEFFDLMGDDNLLVEALQDLIRDEVKNRMREELEANPELARELKDAVRAFYEAKLHQMYATLKFAKASAKLGVNLLPDHLRDELGREIQTVLEKDVAAILEKAL